MKWYVVCNNYNRLIKAILMNAFNIQSFTEYRKYTSKLSRFDSCPGTRINSQGLELPMSKTNFTWPKGVPAIKIRLYVG